MVEQMNEVEAEKIAKGSLRNRGQIAEAQSCGCHYCLATFPSDEVQNWVDDGCTALCPRCGIDSVLPNVTDDASLRSLHHHRFEVAYRFNEAGLPVRVTGE
jgi:hypothetical protein